MNKIAIITGAGTGVGREVAIKLSNDGMIVYLIGRRSKNLEETANECINEAIVYPLDVSDPKKVKNFFDNVDNQHKRIDLLFNNAGVGIKAQTIDQISFEDWKYVIDINLNGMFLCAKYAFKLMRNQKPMGGRIINNGSISSMTPRPGTIAYTSAKHAVLGMTKTISLDGRPFNILCSQIDIGNAETPMTTKMKEGVMQASGKTEKEPVFNAKYVAEAVSQISKLPLDTNVLNMTIMANNMPFVGRG